MLNRRGHHSVRAKAPLNQPTRLLDWNVLASSSARSASNAAAAASGVAGSTFREMKITPLPSQRNLFETQASFTWTGNAHHADSAPFARILRFRNEKSPSIYLKDQMVEQYTANRFPAKLLSHAQLFMGLEECDIQLATFEQKGWRDSKHGAKSA